MISGKTSSGFEFTIDERKANSWNLIKKIAKMQNATNDLQVYALAIDLINALIGEDQEQRLVEHITNVYGYDDAEKVSGEIFEMIGEARRSKELKNSSSSPAASQTTRNHLSVTSQRPTESINMIPYPQDTHQSSVLDYDQTAGSNYP